MSNDSEDQPETMARVGQPGQAESGVAARHAATHRVLCAHADEDGRGAHWLAPGEKCPQQAARSQGGAVNGTEDQDEPLAGFTAGIARRAQWARNHNDGRPEPVWSTGERLAVALVLRDKVTLNDEGYTRLAAARRLAADLDYYGYGRGVDTWLQEIRAAIEGLTDVALPYTRCQSCGLAGEPGSMDYRLADGGGIDWSGAVYASCGFCGRTHGITRDQVLPLDTEYRCPRDGCGAITPCPGSAARVRCHWCGVYGFGPGTASSTDRAHLDEVERLHALELRQAVLNAHRRADRLY